MHPTTSYYLATARIADMRREAERDALVRAARHARTDQPGRPAPRLPATRRRLLTFLRARST